MFNPILRPFVGKQQTRSLGGRSQQGLNTNATIQVQFAEPNLALQRQVMPTERAASSGKYLGFPLQPQSRNELQQMIAVRDELTGSGGYAKLPGNHVYSNTAVQNAVNYLEPFAASRGYSVTGLPQQQAIKWNRVVPQKAATLQPGEELGYPAFRTDWGNTGMGPSEDLIANLKNRPLRRSDRLSTDSLIADYEQAMDMSNVSSMAYRQGGERFIRGNQREGFEVMYPSQGMFDWEPIQYGKPQRWATDGTESLYQNEMLIPSRRVTVNNPVDIALATQAQGQFSGMTKPVVQQTRFRDDSTPLNYYHPVRSTPSGRNYVNYDIVREAPRGIVQYAIQERMAAPIRSTDITEQMMQPKPRNPEVDRVYREYSTPVYGNVPDAFQNPAQNPNLVETRLPMRGTYNMNVLENAETYAAYENNFAKKGGSNGIMLPSTVVEDTALSPYPLTLPSTVDDDFGWERNRVPGLIDAVEDRKMPEGYRLVEPDTDAFDVRDRIAQKARELSSLAKISENQAGRERPVINQETITNPFTGEEYQAQVMRDRRSMRPINELSPEVMTPGQLNALANRGKAMEMQKRLDQTNQAIAEAYGTLPGMETQKVHVGWTDTNGNFQSDTYDWSLQEQLQAGRDFQDLGYGRAITYVPQGQPVTQIADYSSKAMPPWERTKYWMNSSKEIVPVSSPVVVVPDPQYQGPAVRYQFGYLPRVQP